MSEEASGSSFEDQQVDVDGRATQVLTAGDGDPLVFFHGGGIVEGFDCFLPLARSFHLVVPLHPGFGETALDPAVGSVDALVRHYVALFDALGIEAAVLAGHSLGGWIAATFAAEQPERVSRLVVASAYGLDVPGHPLANVRAMQPEEVFQTLTKDPSIWEGRVPSPLDAPFLAARAQEGQALGRLVPGPNDPALPERVRSLAMPKLLIWGDDDRITPVGHAPAWEELLGVRAKIFHGVGHLLFHEDPATVAAIGEFAKAR